MKTLIVDDDRTTRSLLQEILKGYGSVEAAASGKDAVDTVRKALECFAPFDLICLDIMMPGVNGLTVLNEIRDLEAFHRVSVQEGAKIVIVSALSDPVTVLAAIKGQCDHFLVKPIDKAVLLEELHKMALIRLR